MGKISWTDRVSNDEVLRIVEKKKTCKETKEVDRTYP